MGDSDLKIGPKKSQFYLSNALSKARPRSGDINTLGI
jgi:hypothetical protein